MFRGAWQRSAKGSLGSVSAQASRPFPWQPSPHLFCGEVLLQSLSDTWDSFRVCVRQQPAALDLAPSLPPTPPLGQAALGLLSSTLPKGQQGISMCVAEPHRLLSSGSISEDSAGWGSPGDCPDDRCHTLLLVFVGAEELPALGPGPIHMCSGWFCRQRMNSPTGWPS